MGYRSQVGFVVPENAPRFEQLDDDANCFDEIREVDGCRLYFCDHVKWYSGDNLVEAVEAYILEHEDECLFIRVGESDSDLEILGTMWDNPFNLGYVRNVTFDDSV